MQATQSPPPLPDALAGGAGPGPGALADDELRVVARPFLEGLCRGPAPLFGVLYFGPLLRADGLRAELEAVARDHGLAGGGVALCDVAGGAELLAARARPRAGPGRVVVWGSVPATRLPDPLRSAIEGDGLAVDPAQFRHLLEVGRRVHPDPGAPWPDPAALLVDPPPRRPEAPRPMAFDLAEVGLEEVVQSAAVFQREGYFVVYALDRLGWIHVVGDRVHGAGRLGGGAGEPGEERIRAEVAEMGGWADARVMFVRTRPGAAGTRGRGIEVGRLSAAVALARDRAASGQGAVPAPPLPPASPARVAEALLGWGLGAAARELLAQAEREDRCGVEEELLLGHLAAERDPREAAARFRRALDRLPAAEASSPAWRLRRSALLNLLLLELVVGRTYPEAAWDRVERWLAASGEEWVDTPRHAAILALVAGRAGRRAEAWRWADAARAAPGHTDALAAVLEGVGEPPAPVAP